MGRPRKKGADMFMHPSTMSRDPRVRKMNERLGDSGYKCWMYTLEFMTEAEDFSLPYDRDTVGMIAEEAGCNATTVGQTIKVCLELGLFQETDGKVTSKDVFGEILTRRERWREQNRMQYYAQKEQTSDDDGIMQNNSLKRKNNSLKRKNNSLKRKKFSQENLQLADLVDIVENAILSREKIILSRENPPSSLHACAHSLDLNNLDINLSENNINNVPTKVINNNNNNNNNFNYDRRKERKKKKERNEENYQPDLQSGTTIQTPEDTRPTGEILDGYVNKLLDDPSLRQTREKLCTTYGVTEERLREAIENICAFNFIPSGKRHKDFCDFLYHIRHLLRDAISEIQNTNNKTTNSYGRRNHQDNLGWPSDEDREREFYEKYGITRDQLDRHCPISSYAENQGKKSE